MAKKFHIPLRTCVSCREKSSQKSFLRLCCKNGVLSSFEGFGRSFYLCQSCLNEEKRVTKSLMRQCRSSDKDKLMNKLKEIIADDRKS